MQETALLSVACFCFFPSSLFLSAGYTEAMYLVFVLLSFILYDPRKICARRGSGWAFARYPLDRHRDDPRDPMGDGTAVPSPPGRNSCRRWHCVGTGGIWLASFHGLSRGRVRASLGIRHRPGGLAYRNIPRSFRVGGNAGFVPTFRYWKIRLVVIFPALTIWSFRHSRFAVSLYGLGVLALPYFTVGSLPQ